jgi:DNA-binding NtrC family response regulator
MIPAINHYPDASVLILDDDEDIACAAQLLLRRRYGKVLALSDPAALLPLLGRESVDVVMLDLNFTPGRIDGSEGLALLAAIKALPRAPAVIAMTAYADVPLAVQAVKRGAADFITKPWDNAHLVTAIDSVLARRHSAGQPAAIPALIGKSAALREVQAMVAAVAPTEANVLILGENGVGKELVARAVHDASARAGKTFLGVDMGALPESTFESELFGHRKGAFTGAAGERAGRFQAANGGTLFLDEIGNLPLPAQAKLLTALERREVTPLGADRATAVDVRIVSATNLEETRLYDPAVFRPDLLFRLNTIAIRVPPLRERAEDVPILLQHYLAVFEAQYGRDKRTVSGAAVGQLLAYRWPGNVRELRQACERAVILRGAGSEYVYADFGLGPNAAPSSGAASLAAPAKEQGRLDDLERQAVAGAIARAEGNISRAAKSLGISRAALYRKLEKHGI